MKTKVALALLLTVICLAANARITYELSVKGAVAKVILRVVDQDGVAVRDAKIWGAFSASRLKDSVPVEGLTNTNGEFVAQGDCDELLRVDVTKEGYYHTEEKINFMQSKSEPIVVDGKWQPYGEARTVVLKRIKNPTNIGEFGRCSISIPVYDKWIGFDFQKRMWTPPYGDGCCQDVLLKFGRELVERQTDFRMTMEVAFTNNPCAGCYRLNYDNFSDRKNVYCADAEAVYISEMKYVQERHPGFTRVDNRIDKNSYLVFRTRTRVDEDGRLVSAHYGIIGGCWSFYGTMLSGGYLFNPTPNDTNLEDAETARLSRLGYKQSLEFERQRKAKER